MMYTFVINKILENGLILLKFKKTDQHFFKMKTTRRIFYFAANKGDFLILIFFKLD